ncbi:hypothetical protein [Rhodoferax sp.]|uniref:hypothetical protein n=1 Tax=Rhodoferax sp. TaxID=50421 RepID=UPI002770CB88|nr:hypothetical protein [Rhodoferax sp.]
MLPDRSKRYAGIDGDIPRLVLVSNWQLALVALLVLALLVLIFPRKTLVEKLYGQETLDELTLSYIQNLYRAETGNADAAILLTKAQENELDIKTMELRLLPLVDVHDSRQRTAAWSMLAKAYQKALAANPDDKERTRLRAQMTALLQRAIKEKNPEHLSRLFAAAAFGADLPRLGIAFIEGIEAGLAAKALEQYGQEALGQGEYGLAAEYFFKARNQASHEDEARRLFQKGVGTLMAASKFKEAMRSADLHLGNLEGDSATMRYLARAAQAAGEPAQAARYARPLVFQVDRTPIAP